MKLNRVIQLANLTRNPHRKNPNQNRVYDKKGISPCVATHSGGQLEPLITIEYNVR